MRLPSLCLAAAALILAGPAAANAGSVNGTLTVTATVAAGCVFSTSSAIVTFPTLAGGAYTTGAVSSSSNGTLTYLCDSSTSPSLAVGNGANYTTTMRMKGASGGYLPYTLTNTALATPNGAAQTVTFSGQVPQQTTAPAADTYSDTVTITLSF